MDRPISRPLWRRPRVLIAAAGIAVTLAIGGVLVAVQSLTTPTLRLAKDEVTVGVAADGTFHDVAALRAQAAPKDIVFLDALEGGQVLRVFHEAGDLVAAGTPLVQFRNTQLELDVLDREGRLVESITQLQAYEKQLEDTRLANARAAAEIEHNIIRLSRTHARQETLLAAGFVAPAARDQVADELAHYRALRPLQAESTRRQDALRASQLPQIREELATLQESLRITRSKLDELTVRAPVAGRVTDVKLHLGQIVQRGARLGQIVPDTGFKLTAQVDEFYLGRVRVGQAGRASIGGRDYGVKVARVNPQVANSTFQIELDFAAAQPPNLLPGQALEGELDLGGDTRAIVVPAGPWLDASGGAFVMVLDASARRAVRREVRIGRRTAQQVEVLEGLRAGERVITSDYSNFERVERIELTG